MAFIPLPARSTELIEEFTAAGMEHIGSGKTGESFRYHRFPGYRYIHRSDRISIFDFVLASLIPGKGSVLTAMPLLWLNQDEISSIVEKWGGQHIARFGNYIDEFLPEELRGRPEYQTTTIVVKEYETPKFEAIVRGYLTGSGLTSYLGSGQVCGHQLPPGLHDGSKLPENIFTPTTKASVGHDMNIDYLTVRDNYGEGPERMSLELFEAAQVYAEKHNLILADAKFELAKLTLIDEFLTPDTMRIWRKPDWKATQAQDPPKAPVGFDKQFVRDWGKTVETPFKDKSGKPIIGIHKLDTENPEHVAFVSELTVPETVISKSSDLYQEIPELLFDTTLERFWREEGRVQL